MTETSGFLQDQSEIMQKVHELDFLLQLFADKFGIVPLIENGKDTVYSLPEPYLVISGYHKQ